MAMSLFNLTSSLFDDFAFDPYDDLLDDLRHTHRMRIASAASAATPSLCSSVKSSPSRALCSTSACAVSPSKRMRANNWLANVLHDTTAGFSLAVCDVVETPEAYVVTADVPGLTAKDLKVRITDDNVLHLSGKRSQVREEKRTTTHLVERSHGSFARSFALPEQANRDDVQANVDQGVLCVRVAKKAEAQSRVVDIPVQASIPLSSASPTTVSGANHHVDVAATATATANGEDAVDSSA